MTHRATLGQGRLTPLFTMLPENQPVFDDAGRTADSLDRSRIQIQRTFALGRNVNASATAPLQPRHQFPKHHQPEWAPVRLTGRFVKTESNVRKTMVYSNLKSLNTL
jgi:hypothetical protein